MQTPSLQGRVHRALRLLAATGVAAGAVAVTPSSSVAAVGDCSPGATWGASRPDLASQVLDRVNAHRAGIGLGSLSVSPTLTAAAVWKARHMATYNYMTHEDPAPPAARGVGDRLAACGYPANAGWAENIAYGYATAAAVVDGWLNSPGHRANIENGSYRATGVGAAADSRGTLYWSQEFGTVVDAPATPAPAPGGGQGSSAPTITLSSGPPASTTATTASFGWTTTGSPTSTTCSLDGAAAGACSSPTTVSRLPAGTHSMQIIVANAAGSAAANATWTVLNAAPAPAPTTAAPTVRFTTRPPASTTARTATAAWTTTGAPSSTTCSLDGGAEIACSPPIRVSFGRGRHALRVTVANSAGRASATTSWRAL
jgi:uncharacterized protein YkwD